MDGDLTRDEAREAFEGRTLILAVTGGIAVYKVANLASAWTQRGARVRVLMTEAATRFVTPLTFQSITRQPVATNIWQAEEAAAYRPEHIDVADETHCFVMVPATANSIAKAAHGLADDIVSVSLLAYSGPVVVAPAMNDKMWANAAVEENIATLRERGVTIVDPGVGHLACGSFGAGRLADLADVDSAVERVLRDAAAS